MGGSLLVIIAITLQALSNGLLSDNLGGSESVLLSFIAFSVSALVFGIACRVRGGENTPKMQGEVRRLMVLLNGATAVTFLGFYWSLSLIPAPLATAVETGIGPLAMACFMFRSSSGARRLGELGIGVVALALALSVAVRVMSVGDIASTTKFVVGLVVAAVAGTSAASIAVLSHKLGRLKVSPVQVTAHRFHLTYLLAFAVLVLGPDSVLTTSSGSRVTFIALIAMVGVALPLFVLQIGMQRTPPMVVTLLASAVPGMTYLTASFVGAQGFDLLTFVLINGSLVVAFLGPTVVARLRKEPGKGSAGEPSSGQQNARDTVGARPN